MIDQEFVLGIAAGCLVAGCLIGFTISSVIEAIIQCLQDITGGTR